MLFKIVILSIIGSLLAFHFVVDPLFNLHVAYDYLAALFGLNLGFAIWAVLDSKEMT